MIYTVFYAITDNPNRPLVLADLRSTTEELPEPLTKSTIDEMRDRLREFGHAPVALMGMVLIDDIST